MNLEKEYVRNLFRKYINGDCGPLEIESVLKYLEDAGYQEQMKELINETLQTPLDPKVGLSPATTAQMFSSIRKRTESNHIATTRKMFLAPYSLMGFLKVAAMFIGLVIAIGISYKVYDVVTYTTYTTLFGETRKITLPDGSHVILNGNSTLKFPNKWKSGVRSVDLEGEAYFWVLHTKDNKKFTVVTHDNLNIEVLGTEFNVSSRKEKDRIVLTSGSVRLSKKEIVREKPLIMQPGELVEVSNDSKDYILKKDINTRLYTSWKEKMLVLDHTDFYEIKAMLEQTYGLVVKIPDKRLLEKKFTGEIPNNSINMLVNALSISFGLKVTLMDNVVEFKDN